MTPELLSEYLATFRRRSFRPFRLVLEGGTEIVVASMSHIKLSDKFVTVMQGQTWSSFEIAAITEILMKD